MRTLATFALFAVLGLIGRPLTASDECGGPGCCAHCGCHAACVQKTCQVVCDVKKEVKTCWHVECQEFCPLMPGCRDRCDCCPPTPRCGQPKCVKKLVKTQYTVDVPVYKCVVKYLCPDCAGDGAGAPRSAAPSPPSTPPTPPPAASHTRSPAP